MSCIIGEAFFRTAMMWGMGLIVVAVLFALVLAIAALSKYVLLR